MIQAIIFDCFGVLTTDGWLEFKQTYFDTDHTLSDQATLLNQKADKGEITFEALLREVSQMAGVSHEDAGRQIGIHPPDAHLLAYIGTLHETYKIGILSNAASDWTHELFTAAQLRLFDAIVLSCELGVIKPASQMYAAIVDRLGVLPEQCVYIDDRQRNIDAASAMGMRGIVYTDFPQFKRDIERLLRT